MANDTPQYKIFNEIYGMRLSLSLSLLLQIKLENEMHALLILSIKFYNIILRKKNQMKINILFKCSIDFNF